MGIIIATSLRQPIIVSMIERIRDDDDDER